MGESLTAADIADLNRWHEVISRDVHYFLDRSGLAHVRLRTPEAAHDPILIRHMNYHERKKRELFAELERD